MQLDGIGYVLELKANAHAQVGIEQGQIEIGN